MYEYKIRVYEMKSFKPKDFEAMTSEKEAIMSEMGKQGWRLINIVVNAFPALAHRYEMVFEREIRN